MIGLVTRFIRYRRPSTAANFLLSLAALLHYASWFLVYQPETFDISGSWDFGPPRFGITTILVLGGLMLCWGTRNGLGRAFGVVAILAGFAVAYPGVVFPVEYVEGGSK